MVRALAGEARASGVRVTPGYAHINSSVKEGKCMRTGADVYVLRNADFMTGVRFCKHVKQIVAKFFRQYVLREALSKADETRPPGSGSPMMLDRSFTFTDLITSSTIKVCTFAFYPKLHVR